MLIRWLLKRHKQRRAATPPTQTASPRHRSFRRVHLALHQFRYDLRSFTRNKQARFSTLALPVVLLVAFVSIGGGNKTLVQDGHSIKSASFFVPGLIAFAIVAASFANLLVDLIGQRETGVLKRRRATPVPAWTLIAGRTLTAAAVSLATALLLLIVGGNVYDIDIPTHALPTVAVTILLGSFTFSCLAYALAPMIRSAGAIQPVLQLVLLPLYAISGVLLPDSKNPSWLVDIASVLPLEHVAHALHHAFDPQSGLTPGAADVLIPAAWAAAALAIALKRFTWLPNATR